MSLSGARFDITGASGSQGLLGPKESWKAYILPRGGYASQDSSSTKITFDSAGVAGRFAANDWIQAGLDVSNIRQVSASAGNSITVSGSALSVSENDRIFVFGQTQPSVSGSSATYTDPNTTIYVRDDETGDTYTNSMVTSSANGTIQFFAGVNYYDCIIQDANQTNQASVVDMEIGLVGGISSTGDAIFTNVTVNGILGVTGQVNLDGQVVVGQTISIVGTSGNYYHLGTAKFGQTLTVDGAFGVTDVSVFGSTIVVVGTSGNYYHTGSVHLGNTLTVEGPVGFTAGVDFASTAGFTGIVAFGSTVTATAGVSFGSTVTLAGNVDAYRYNSTIGTSMSTGVSLTGTWVGDATTTIDPGSNDVRGSFWIGNGTSNTGRPGVYVTFTDGVYGLTPSVVVSRYKDALGVMTKFWVVESVGPAFFHVILSDAPTNGTTYGCQYIVMG